MQGVGDKLSLGERRHQVRFIFLNYINLVFSNSIPQYYSIISDVIVTLVIPFYYFSLCGVYQM